MLFALLTACATLPTPDGCADLTPPPVVACFGGDALEWPGYGEVSFAVDGEVVSVTTGPRPATCEIDVGNGQLQEGVIVEIEDAEGARSTLAFALPELEGTVVSVGDFVNLSTTFTFGEFGPDEGHVGLSVYDGDVVTGVLAVLEAGALEGIGGFELAEGKTRCTEDDGCGVFSKYDLDVTLAGTTHSIPYGETLDLGEGERFYNGGYERQAEGQTDVCPDWYVAQVTVAWAREGS